MPTVPENSPQIPMKTLAHKYQCQIPGEAFGIWNLKCHLCLFEPRVGVQTVIVTNMGFEMGWFIPYLVERLIEKVIHDFHLDPTQLIWIEHYSNELQKLAETDFSLVTFEWDNGQVQNLQWNHISPNILPILTNEPLQQVSA